MSTYNYSIMPTVHFAYFLCRSPKYTAPEVFVLRDKVKSGPKVDVWSLGIIILELLIGRTIWPHMKLGQCVRKVLALLHYDGSVFERLAREGDRLKVYQVIRLLKLEVYV